MYIFEHTTRLQLLTFLAQNCQNTKLLTRMIELNGIWRSIKAAENQINM